MQQAVDNIVDKARQLQREHDLQLLRRRFLKISASQLNPTLQDYAAAHGFYNALQFLEAQDLDS